MSASLMEALQSLVTPAMLKTATSTLGESESALTSGLGGIVSKILNALVSSSGDSAMMNSVAGLVTAHSRDAGSLSDVTGLLTGGLPTATGAVAGNQLLGHLFGVREGGIAQAVAAAAGLKPQSAAALMALAGPLVLGALSKTPNAGSLTGTALAGLLNAERGSILGTTAGTGTASSTAPSAARPAAPPPAPQAAAPAPVKPAAPPAAAATTAQVAAGAATAAGAAATAAARSATSTVAQAGSSAAAATSAAAREVIRPTASTEGGIGLSWLLWFIPLIILGVLGFLAWQNQQAFLGEKSAPAAAPAVEKKSEAAPTTAPVTTAAIPAPAALAPEAAPAVAMDAGNGMLKLALMEGSSITYAKDGVEGKLVGFLQDANSVIDKKTWFDFDRLNFETGSTNLTAESREQVANIAAVLKAFPTSAIKIGGYTDNVGNPDSNLKLSDERAKKVMSELVALGIKAERLDAEGYGEQFPVAENDTDEGRSKNRRTALSVRAR